MYLMAVTLKGLLGWGLVILLVGIIIGVMLEGSFR